MAFKAFFNPLEYFIAAVTLRTASTFILSFSLTLTCTAHLHQGPNGQIAELHILIAKHKSYHSSKQFYLINVGG